MIREEEAKTKWCPFARVGGGQGMDGASYNRIEHHGGEISHTVATCIGSACMGWNKINTDSKFRVTTKDGKVEIYCWDPSKESSDYYIGVKVEPLSELNYGDCGLKYR